MCGKSSQSTQTVSIPPEVLAQYRAVTERANQIDQQAFQPYSNDPNDFVAPLNQTQNYGIANTNAAANQAQPYYGAATNYALAGGNAVNPTQIGAQQIGQYMNPFLGTVVGNTAALLNQQQQAQMSGQTGNAIQQGAFGGDRAGIAAANLAGQQQLAFGNAISPLLTQGYNTALQTALQQQGVDLGAQQANRQALQQTASALAGLGAGAQTAALQGAQAQLSAGQVQQQTEQAGKTALYSQHQQAVSLPYQQLQQQANISEGIGANSGSTTTGSSELSDRRAKHDVHEIGRTFDGQPIYNFKYNGDDRTQIGLMAQDVEKHHPEAVGLAGGMKTVDYGKATHDAARRGHFANGGLAGNSEGGMVHMGHMGEGYAGGGMAEPMGYGSSPFVGYDPTAAYQSLYGGLLGHQGGMGAQGGFSIPTGSPGRAQLVTPSMKMPELPSAGDEAKKAADTAIALGKLGNDAHLFHFGNAEDRNWTSKPSVSSGVAGSKLVNSMAPIIARNNAALSSEANSSGIGAKSTENPEATTDSGTDSLGSESADISFEKRGGRIGFGLGGGMPYAGSTETDVPDEKLDANKLMQADPSGLAKPGGGGASGLLGAAGSLASLIPGGQAIGSALGAGSKIAGLLAFAHGGSAGDGGDDEESGDFVPKKEDIPDDNPHAQLNVPPLNMPKPDSGMSGASQGLGAMAAILPLLMAAKNGGAVGYAEGGDVGDGDDSPLLRSIMGQLSGVDQEKFLDEMQEDGAAPKPESAPIGLGPKDGGSAPLPAASGIAQGLRAKIMKGEGTDKFTNPYDVVYGANPRTGLSPYANPHDHLSSMPIGDVQDFQRQLIGATKGKVRGLGPNLGTGAVGAYQFTRDTLANLAHKLYGDNWRSMKFTPEVQDALAAELARERNGHLAGTWAAFRNEGPEGKALRAQAGYASGGLVGRHGYEEGGSPIRTDENGYLIDPSDSSDDSEGYGDEGYTPSGQMGSSEFASPYSEKLVNDALDQAGGNINQNMTDEAAQADADTQRQLQPFLTKAGRAAGQRINQMADQEGIPRDRGVLGNVLHGKFISGLGKGEADSWLPLLAGIGASMSGPYRGIVGLGQGLAAGAKTAQGLRQYELENDIRRGQLGVAQRQADTNRLHVLTNAVPQFMSRFRDAGNGYFYDPTGHFAGSGPLGANGRPMLTAGEMDRLRGNFIDQIARNYQMDPTQVSAAAGLSPDAGPGGGGLMPPTPAPTGGATPAPDAAATPTGQPTQHITRHHPMRKAVSAGPAWAEPKNYATAPEYTDMPARTPGAAYTPETDPDVLQRRANSGDQGAAALLNRYRSGDFAPIVASTQRPDSAYTSWASGLKTQRANVDTDRRSAVDFRNGASNYKTERDAVVTPSDAFLASAKDHDPSRTGRGLVYQMSRGLSPYGVVGGEASNITDDASAARAMAQGAAGIARKYGIPFATPNMDPATTSAGSLYYGVMLERAAANAAHHKADTFYHHDTALSGQGGIGQMSKFNREWAAGNPVTKFLGQDVSRNGFIKGMTPQEKAQYVQYLPPVPKNGTPRNGLYRFKNGLVEYDNGTPYPGGKPGSRLMAN